MTVELLQWMGALPLLLAFGYLATFNARCMIGHAGRRKPSPVPLVAGLLGGMGLLLLPVGSLSSRFAFAWLPLVLDPGSGIYLLGAAYVIFRDR